MFNRNRETETAPAPYPRAEPSWMPHPGCLVSLGQSEHAYIDAKTKKWKTTSVELFYDLRHTAKRYIRYEGDTAIQPLFESSGKEDQVIERFEGPLRKPECSAYEPAAPDRKAKVLPVPITRDNPHGRLGKSAQPSPYGIEEGRLISIPPERPQAGVGQAVARGRSVGTT